MRRTGSIFTTLAVALVATVGVAGGGYTIVTGNSIASLIATCDTPTGAVATPVAYNGGGPACDGDKAKAKTVAAGDKSDCSKPKAGAKAIAVGDKAGCDMKGGKKGAKGDDCDMKGGKDADCGMTCEGGKTIGVADAGSHCDKPGEKKAVAAANGESCHGESGAKAVAVGDYACKAESMMNKEQMAARTKLHEELLPKIQNVRELSNGYAIDFPACSGTLVQVAEMVAMSRECCDFMDYNIVADSNGGAVHLIMTGDAGAKAFLAKSLAPMVVPASDTGESCCDADEGLKAVAAMDPACVASCEDKAAKGGKSGKVGKVGKVKDADTTDLD